MNNRYTPSYSYAASQTNQAARWAAHLPDFIFLVGWWFFFTELGHTLIMVLTKGCYCDFSQPETPCSGVYMLMFEIALSLILTVPLFVYFCRGIFIEKVGLGKKLIILLCSAGAAFLFPRLLLMVEEGFSSLLPNIASIEFTPWADADIVRFVRSRYG